MRRVLRAFEALEKFIDLFGPTGRQAPFVASLPLVVWPGAPNSFLLLVVRMLLVAMPGAPNSFLLLVGRMLLVGMPGALIASCY